MILCYGHCRVGLILECKSVHVIHLLLCDKFRKVDHRFGIIITCSMDFAVVNWHVSHCQRSDEWNQRVTLNLKTRFINRDNETSQKPRIIQRRMRQDKTVTSCASERVNSDWKRVLSTYHVLQNSCVNRW